VEDKASYKMSWNEKGFKAALDVWPREEMTSIIMKLNQLEKSQPGGKFAAQMLNPHSFLADLCVKERLLTSVADILGPDLVLVSTTLFTKYPAQDSGAKYVGAHQDLKYWGLHPHQEVTAWLALDKAGPHNGSLCFLPGSHQAGLLDHDQGDRENNILQENQDIFLTDKDISSLVQSDLQPGQASLHDGLLVHLSPPNLSRERRTGLQMIFTTPQVKLMEQTYTNKYDEEWRLPVLVRGKDSFGHLKYVNTVEQIVTSQTS